MVEVTHSSGHPYTSLTVFYTQDYRDTIARIAWFKPDVLPVVEEGETATVTVSSPRTQ